MSTKRLISWSTTTLPNGTNFAGGMIIPDCTVLERGEDDSVITETPVETGSVSNDHKYDLPPELEQEFAFSPGSSGNTARSSDYLDQIYQKLLNLKSAAIFLTVVTGKRTYQNLLIKTVVQTTDAKTENILSVKVSYKALILAQTQTVSISSSAVQTNPGKTATTVNTGTVNLGNAPNFNSGNPTGS